MRPLMSNFRGYMEDMILYKTAMGYSASTYDRAFRTLDMFCCTHFPDETSLTRELVEKWSRLSENETINSLNRRTATIRELGRYMQSIGLPAYIMPPKMTAKQTRYVPHIFTGQELAAFFYGTDHYKKLAWDPLSQYIVPVIFRVLFCCGLRPTEGLLIKSEDINLETGRIYIRQAKRHKDRAVVLSDDVRTLCIAYDRILENMCVQTEYFFPDKDGKARGIRWLSYQFQKCWRIAGITELPAPTPRIYDFRHTFATRRLHDWMDAGENLYSMLPYLSAYMGHSTFTATAYYIHLLPERLKESPAIDWRAFEDLLPEVPS